MIAVISFVTGVAMTAGAYQYALARRARRSRHLNPGALIMAVRAEIQTQLDRLAQVPAAIEAAKAAAAQAATAQANQDHADEVAALTTATDAVVAAATPAAS